MADVTKILHAIEHGDAQAVDVLLPAIYDELRKLAAQKLAGERPGQTLEPTALVHEAYMKLAGAGQSHWAGRAHFFAAAAEAMRRILIDNARRKQAVRHGGEHQRVELTDALAAIETPSTDVIALDASLSKLAAEDPIKAELVKLRYFAGLTIEEAAATLDISRSTAARYWEYARAWLRHELDSAM